MALTVIFVLQCEHCEKVEELKQSLEFATPAETVPIVLDIQDDPEWEILDDGLYCSACIKFLTNTVCDA